MISRDTINTCAFIEAADCYRKLAQNNQALKYYERTVTLAPKNKYARIQHITLLLSLEKYQEALKESSLMIETDSSANILHLQAKNEKDNQSKQKIEDFSGTDSLHLPERNKKRLQPSTDCSLSL
ncbi:tetratricopeptide repeat protein [Bacteroides bouchesdurhonensis]